MMTLIVATRNAHKLAEIRFILGDTFRFLTLKDFPSAPAVQEDAQTFAGNATKKSVELAHWLSSHDSRFTFHASRPTFALADDSGLEVDALNGAPGVHSARFAALDTAGAANSPDAENIAKLLRLLKDVPLEKRAARFRCVLALTPIFPQAPHHASPACAANEFEIQTELFEGVCEGRIGFSPIGAGGFGYDPLFIPNGYEQSFAELGEATKNKFSHRARALEKLKRHLDKL